MRTARLAFPDGARAEIIVGLNYGVIAKWPAKLGPPHPDPSSIIDQQTSDRKLMNIHL